MVDFNWWFSKLSNQYTTPLPTSHPHTLRHSQDVHKHSTNSCDQHDVSINLIVLVDDPENGLVHQHTSQQPDDQDRDDSSHNLCDYVRGKGRRGTGRIELFIMYTHPSNYTMTCTIEHNREGVELLTYVQYNMCM